MGYAIIESWNILDALYMTVITLTTTGFEEVHDLDLYGRIFTIVLLTSGILAAAVAVASFTSFLVEGEILNILGRRKLTKELNRLKNHYILCGYGRIGRVIAREFADNNISFVVVESAYERVEEAIKNGYTALHGNSVEDEILIDAGVMRAKGLIAAVSTTADNVYITLSAKSLNPDIFVMGRAEDDTSTRRLTAAGADEVVSPYMIGGRRMANSILRPAMVEFIDVAIGRKNFELVMEEVTIGKRSHLIGKTISDSEIRNRFGTIIVAILKPDGKMIYNPPPDSLMEVGDKIIAMGESENVKALVKALGS